MDSLLQKARKNFHKALLANTLTINAKGVASNADSSSKKSTAVAREIARLLKAETSGEKQAGQTLGANFEQISALFLQSTFPHLQHLRPGKWKIEQISSRNRLKIAEYQQYAHLARLDEALSREPELAVALGNDYTISPDIIISRATEQAEALGYQLLSPQEKLAQAADLIETPNALPVLHASVSCKWTIRSDRAQNARSEALNLIRNRKGKLPHIVVVTAEPTPARLASLALGTGDIDCVYHFALYELEAALATLEYSEMQDNLNWLTTGKRLKDISDLPLDLAV